MCVAVWVTVVTVYHVDFKVANDAIIHKSIISSFSINSRGFYDSIDNIL